MLQMTNRFQISGFKSQKGGREAGCPRFAAGASATVGRLLGQSRPSLMVNGCGGSGEGPAVAVFSAEKFFGARGVGGAGRLNFRLQMTNKFQISGFKSQKRRQGGSPCFAAAAPWGPAFARGYGLTQSARSPKPIQLFSCFLGQFFGLLNFGNFVEKPPKQFRNAFIAQTGNR